MLLLILQYNTCAIDVNIMLRNQQLFVRCVKENTGTREFPVCTLNIPYYAEYLSANRMSHR